MIRLGIVDDHPVVREGTAALLREQPDIEVVTVAGDAETAVPLLADERLDVVLLDIRLGSASGLHLLSLERQSAKPAIVVLTAYDYPKYAEAALRLGAIGYVLKSSPFNELLTAIRKGRCWRVRLRRQAVSTGAAYAARDSDRIARSGRPHQRRDRRPTRHQRAHRRDASSPPVRA